MTDTSKTPEPDFSKATPRPWRASGMWRPPVGNHAIDTRELNADGNVFYGYSIAGSDENGSPILPTLAAVHNFPNSIHANAALIVEAVNSYDETREQLSSAKAEIERLREALERDRSNVAIGVSALKRVISSREHLREAGRGSFAYDDDRYQQEFGHALDELEAALKPLQQIARDWSDCPTDADKIAKARANTTPSPDPKDAVIAGLGSAAAQDVLAERQRQKDAEGWTPKHDDTHKYGEMAGAAACYALTGVAHWACGAAIDTFWPWDKSWWKPTNPRRDLVKAAALLLAEIERLDRLSLAKQGGSDG